MLNQGKIWYKLSFNFGVCWFSDTHANFIHGLQPVSRPKFETMDINYGLDLYFLILTTIRSRKDQILEEGYKQTSSLNNHSQNRDQLS